MIKWDLPVTASHVHLGEVLGMSDTLDVVLHSGNGKVSNRDSVDLSKVRPQAAVECIIYLFIYFIRSNI